jgi:AraC-like DNA-binding protein
MRRAILFIWILAFLLAGSGLVRQVSRFRSRTRRVVPGWGLVATPFDDRGTGGSSVASVDTENGLVRFQWLLGTKASIPYVGFLWERSDRSIFSFVGWDSLALVWDADHGKAVRVTIQVDQPGLTVADRPLSRRYLQLEAAPPKVRGRSSWALSEFRTPAWWLRENHQPLAEAPEFLNRVLALSIENGETNFPGTSDKVRISEVELVKADPSRLPSLLLLGGALVLGAAAWRTGRISPSGNDPNPPGAQVALSPMRLEIPPQRSEQVRIVLESHYCDPDLSLATLAKELAMGEDLVSREIRRTFQDTFKGVLNRMRLQEARRLLAESDLGIAEIAYKVGYGSVSHFNRLAREAWGRTPTEERAASRRDGDGGGNPTRPTT